jgi:hypothetical protein
MTIAPSVIGVAGLWWLRTALLAGFVFRTSTEPRSLARCLTQKEADFALLGRLRAGLLGNITCLKARPRAIVSLKQLQYFVDPSGIKVVKVIATQTAKPNAGFVAASIGVIIALFGASGVFGQLQEALNTIWGVKS